MSEEDILDFISQNPLPSAAVRQVAHYILQKVEALDDFQIHLISRIQEKSLSIDEIVEIKKEIWKCIDQSSGDIYKDSKNRILICMLSDVEKLDEQLAEMIYYWSSNIGVDQDAVDSAMEQVLKAFEAENANRAPKAR